MRIYAFVTRVPMYAREMLDRVGGMLAWDVIGPTGERDMVLEQSPGLAFVRLMDMLGTSVRIESTTDISMGNLVQSYLVVVTTDEVDNSGTGRQGP